MNEVLDRFRALKRIPQKHMMKGRSRAVFQPLRRTVFGHCLSASPSSFCGRVTSGLKPRILLVFLDQFPAGQAADIP